MKAKTILLDVGGTFIKCSDNRQVAINSDGSREEIISALKEALNGADTAALAVPGPFDYNKGVFWMKHKFAALYGEKLSDLFPGVTFHFVHDVVGMLLGEMASGAGRGYKSVALVTLGTGLGFGIAVDGKVLLKEDGTPTESAWDLPYKDGILEDYVSKRGFLRGYEGITVKQLAQMVKNGDEGARKRFLETAKILAKNISPMLEKYGVECLLMGGQISRSFDLMEEALKENLPKSCTVKCVSDFENATFNGLETLI